jgi:hypothetical protein
MNYQEIRRTDASFTGKSLYLRHQTDRIKVANIPKLLVVSGKERFYEQPKSEFRVSHTRSFAI